MKIFLLLKIQGLFFDTDILSTIQYNYNVLMSSEIFLAQT